ncbi:hypothetical protein NMY3_01409 [Candidatus Nitrosocosmicus oleophilus]|uniref:Uncharacterized protein n=1 Tax=Candidatus Nitrosocosmicus oleophilus TaxID=1353260 RepID=A0A654LZ49_9ARCH|nr:hypothetical protein NMY3_01409 [Candidatus Nitrosocosmicus oleophilus]
MYKTNQSLINARYFQILIGILALIVINKRLTKSQISISLDNQVISQYLLPKYRKERDNVEMSCIVLVKHLYLACFLKIYLSFSLKTRSCPNMTAFDYNYLITVKKIIQVGRILTDHLVLWLTY